MIDPNHVEAVFKTCLYEDHELVGDQLPGDAMVIDGITSKWGLHPGRVTEHKAEITEWLREIGDEFHMSKGGGWSFLNLCNDKHGNQWTGLHRIMELLCVLAIATKQGKWLMPREMWAVFPGGVPYVGFDLDGGFAKAEPVVSQA